MIHEHPETANHLKRSVPIVANSKTARFLIGVICAWALLGSYAARTLPRSSSTPPSWYHHWAIMVPGVVFTLPAILFEMLLDNFVPTGPAYNESRSRSLRALSPVIRSCWCVLLFFLLNLIVRFFEIRRHGHAPKAIEIEQDKAAG